MRMLISLLSVVVLACAKAQYGQVYPGGYANPFPQYYNPYGGDYLRNFGLITSILLPTKTVTSTTTTVTTCTASVVGACTGRRRRGIIIGDEEEHKIAPSAIQKVEGTALAELVSAESGRQIYYPAASPYGYYYPQPVPQPFEIQSTINPHYYGPAAMPYYYPYPYAPVVPVPAQVPADKLLWTVTSTSYVTATSTYTSVPPCSSAQTAYSQCPTSG